MKRQETLFATFELSKLAKEKGFNGLCSAYYDFFENEKIERFHYNLPVFKKWGMWYSHNNHKYTKNENEIGITITSAPLYDQLTNWLRDEKDIDITIMPVFREKCGYDSFKRDGYTLEITRIEPCQYLTWSDFNQCAEDRDEENKEHDVSERCLKPSFKTYKEALNEAIKQGLNLIK